MAKFLTVAFIVVSIRSMFCGNLAGVYEDSKTLAFSVAVEIETLVGVIKSMEISGSEKSQVQGFLEEKLENIFLDLSRRPFFSHEGQFQCHQVVIFGDGGQGHLSSCNSRGVCRVQEFGSHGDDRVQYQYPRVDRKCQGFSLLIKIGSNQPVLIVSKNRDSLMLDIFRDQIPGLHLHKVTDLITTIYYLHERQKVYGLKGRLDIDYAEDPKIQAQIAYSKIKEALYLAKRIRRVTAVVNRIFKRNKCKNSSSRFARHLITRYEANHAKKVANEVLRETIAEYAILRFAYQEWAHTSNWEWHWKKEMRLRSVTFYRTDTGTTGAVQCLDFENSIFSISLPNGNHYKNVHLGEKENPSDKSDKFFLTVMERDVKLFEYQTSAAPFMRAGHTAYGGYLVNALSSLKFVTLGNDAQLKILAILYEGTMLG